MSSKKRGRRMNKYSGMIVNLREGRGETQAQFAKTLGVTQPMVSAWEKGRDIPSANFCLQLGNLASYPDSVLFWQGAGLDQEAMVRASEKILWERGTALVTEGTVRIPCFLKTAQGTKRLDGLFPISAEFRGSGASTVCLVIDETASSLELPAGVHIIVDESTKNTEKLSSLREHVILIESSVPFRVSADKTSIHYRFGSLYMGRLRFKPETLMPDESGRFSITWVAILNPDEPTFSWRLRNQGTLIGHSTYFPEKSPASEKENAKFQEAAERHAISEMRPKLGIKILGEVRGCFWPSSGESR